MKEINFTKKDISNLTIYNKGGFEGRIYIYSQDLLVKVFEEYLRGVLDFDRKKYKLIKLNEMNIAENIMITPKQLLNIDGNFSGYIMPKIEDSITLNNIRDYRKLIKVYRILFENLEFMHSNGIVVNDIKPENILLVKNQRPVFIDVDSMGVGDLSADNLGVNSYVTKHIPNMDEKMKNNSIKDIDKLKLLASFLYTLRDDKNYTIMQNLFSSDLSQEFKSFLATAMRQDHNLSLILADSQKMFLEEEMRERGRRHGI